MNWRKRRNVLDDLRSDNLAGSAPGSETIQNNDLVVLEGGGEISLAVREVLLARFPWKYHKTTQNKYPKQCRLQRGEAGFEIEKDHKKSWSWRLKWSEESVVADRASVAIPRAAPIIQARSSNPTINLEQAILPHCALHPICRLHPSIMYHPAPCAHFHPSLQFEQKETSPQLT